MLLPLVWDKLGIPLGHALGPLAERDGRGAGLALGFGGFSTGIRGLRGNGGRRGAVRRGME